MNFPIDPTLPARQDHMPDPEVRKVAREFEASFLAEMMKYSGVNKTSDEFGGGAGEDAFSSMLTQSYATAMSDAGGIGIAEHIYKAIVAKNGE